MGAALKKPRVAVGAAAAVADMLLERRRPAVTRRLAPRERRVEAVAAALLVAVATAMAIAAPAADDVSTAALLTACYALVRRVRFQLGPGFVRPTQLVFVPMLFLTPAAAVPALVVAGSLLGELPDLLRRGAHRERLLVTIADGWYAVGPAIVIATLADGGGAHDATWAVLVLALAAQIAFDLAASTLREGFGAQIAPAELLPVLALIYVFDALLAPVGFMAVLASEVHEYAYLLAIAPGVLLGLIARERSARIAHELALERAFRRSTRALDARADELRRQAGRLQQPDRRVGEAPAGLEDRAALERVLLSTTIEAVQAECGRLSELAPSGELVPRLTIGRHDGLGAAEQALGTQRAGALAIAVGHSHVLAVARRGKPFSPVERDLLEHLAAQAAVSLENLRLEELMRRTEAELRAILEGVADAVAAEDADGHLVYVNAAAAKLLNGSQELGARLGIAPERLPGRRVLSGVPAEPLVVRHPGEPRWSRVKASPVLEDGAARLAISVIEDVTEIKQAEEAQRFLAESSRALARSLEVEATLPAVARLAAANIADACAIHLVEDGEERLVGYAGRGGSGEQRAVPIRVRDGVAGRLVLTRPRVDAAVVDDLALRVGAAVDNARLYRTRAAIAQTLQQSLLPPVLPEIPGLEAAARYRPIGEGNDVGGDFYDLFPTGEREWFAVMGDVCGKGAQAASVTALARYTIRAAVMRHRSPAGILRYLNSAMLRQGAGRFVTLAVARLQLEPDGVAVTVACGGHPCPRILRATGLVERIGAIGTVLGVLQEVELSDRSAHLRAGDALVLYTDGLTEISAPRIWSDGQLDAAVAGARRQSADGIVDHLLARAVAEAPGPARDDLALLALRVQPLL